MFKKIPSFLITQDYDWDRFKSINYSIRFVDSYGVGSYFYPINDPRTLVSLIKPGFFTIPPTLSYCEFTNLAVVRPHRDSNDTVALNFYINTSGSVTSFYKQPDEGIVEKRYGKLAYTESSNNLFEIGRFVANKYDCYLLDVTVLHGLQKTTPEPRTMLTCRWNRYDYQTILNSLNF
jgi:hypothetical protein